MCFPPFSDARFTKKPICKFCSDLKVSEIHISVSWRFNPQWEWSGRRTDISACEGAVTWVSRVHGQAVVDNGCGEWKCSLRYLNARLIALHRRWFALNKRFSRVFFDGGFWMIFQEIAFSTGGCRWQREWESIVTTLCYILIHYPQHVVWQLMAFALFTLTFLQSAIHLLVWTSHSIKTDGSIYLKGDLFWGICVLEWFSIVMLLEGTLLESCAGISPSIVLDTIHNATWLHQGFSVPMLFFSKCPCSWWRTFWVWDFISRVYNSCGENTALSILFAADMTAQPIIFTILFWTPDFDCFIPDISNFSSFKLAQRFYLFPVNHIDIISLYYLSQ